MGAILPLSAFLLPLVISWLLTAAALHWAPRLGLLDQPDARKLQPRPITSGGGVAIYLAVAAATLLLPGSLDKSSITLLGPGAVVVGLGLIDDLRGLSWQLRLFVQFAVATAAISLHPSDHGWLLRVAEVFWIVGLINAFNMIDNMDALSGGVAWISSAMFTLALCFGGAATADWQAAWPFLILMGALSGFLWFNRPPAQIYLGDAGSTFLGFYVGVRSLELSSVQAAPLQKWLLPLCLLAVPWYDLTSVVALRLWQRRSPFHADKQHLSHRLLKLGLSSRAAVRVIDLLAIASGLTGLLLLQLDELAAILLAAAFVCGWLAIAALEYAGHFRSASGKSG